MKFDDFRQGIATGLFAALGDGGRWTEMLHRGRDFAHLRALVADENARSGGAFAQAIRRLSGTCSRGELQLVKAVCHMCDFSDLADELSAGHAWDGLGSADGATRRAIAVCIIHAP